MHGQSEACTNAQVLASYGHVRDLPAKQGAVDPERDFQMTWAVMPSAHSRIKEISSSLSNAKSLVLATDPDREGEAIAWHLQEELQVDESQSFASCHSYLSLRSSGPPTKLALLSGSRIEKALP